MRTLYNLWINYVTGIILSNEYTFHCKFCGKDFGSSVIDLATHIGRDHYESKNNS
jgi:hypothetical protein